MQKTNYTLYQLVQLNAFPWLKQTYSAYRNAMLKDKMGKNYLKAKKEITDHGYVYQIQGKHVHTFVLKHDTR